MKGAALVCNLWIVWVRRFMNDAEHLGGAEQAISAQKPIKECMRIVL